MPLFDYLRKLVFRPTVRVSFLLLLSIGCNAGLGSYQSADDDGSDDIVTDSNAGSEAMSEASSSDEWRSDSDGDSDATVSTSRDSDPVEDCLIVGDEDGDGKADCQDPDCDNKVCGSASTERCCDGSCVDTTTNPLHCQGCGIECDVDNYFKCEDVGGRGACRCSYAHNCWGENPMCSTDSHCECRTDNECHPEQHCVTDSGYCSY